MGLIILERHEFISSVAADVSLSPSPLLLQLRLCESRCDDALELVGNQRCATDQEAINIRLRCQFIAIGTFDRASVNDTRGCSYLSAYLGCQPSANLQVHLLCLLRCGSLASSNGPNWFVRLSERARESENENLSLACIVHTITTLLQSEMLAGTKQSIISTPQRSTDLLRAYQ
jgi:hypothetical protein